ncbi:MAG: hypothetical protein ACR2PA_10020 [Hyphomicrobiaceae bacterium]
MSHPAKSHPAVATLVSEIKTVLASTHNARDITDRVAALAQPLATDRDWIEPRCHATDESQGIGITILHAEPDNTLLIETVCWQAGRGVAPHDHQTWGVVVGLEGEETNVTWRRLDDGSQDGHASLEPSDEIVVRSGDIVQLLPTDIHSVRNDGKTNSMSLHIYGRDLATVDRSEFDPINKTQRPCPRRIRR